MSGSISNEVFLKALSTRVEQHIKFFDALEKIRWSFTTAFGVGTLAALFLTAGASSTGGRVAVGYALVLILGFAAIIAQVRIYALIVVLWRRILILQSAESSIIRKHFPISDTLSGAMLSPRVGVDVIPEIRAA